MLFTTSSEKLPTRPPCANSVCHLLCSSTTDLHNEKVCEGLEASLSRHITPPTPLRHLPWRICCPQAWVWALSRRAQGRRDNVVVVGQRGSQICNEVLVGVVDECKRWVTECERSYWGRSPKPVRAVAARGECWGGLGEVSLQRRRFCFEIDVEKSWGALNLVLGSRTLD